MILALWMATQPAAAQAVTDAEIHTVVEQLYNKRLPQTATCVARPELPDVFRDAVAVGVRRGTKGCQLIGVYTNGGFQKVPSAATASIRASRWKEASPAERGEALKVWTSEFLLAFANVEGEGSVRVSGEDITVKQTYLHRVEGQGNSARSDGTFRFQGSNAKLVEKKQEAQQHYRTALQVRSEKVSGVTTEQVSQGINSKGALIQKCFRDYWEENLDYQGRVRLTWKIEGGVTKDVGVIGGDDAPEKLASCYAFQAVDEIQWGESVNGGVRWVFAVFRGETEAP